MTRLGYQIPNFTYPDTRSDEIFDRVVAQAKAAEAAGYDRVMVMDHFYQLPGIGAPEEPMLECYTMLSALAQHTQKVRLSALVMNWMNFSAASGFLEKLDIPKPQPPKVAALFPPRPCTIGMMPTLCCTGLLFAWTRFQA